MFNRFYNSFICVYYLFMLMKIKLLTFSLLLACAGVSAQSDEWKDPAKNAVNREPMHTNYFAYENDDLAAGRVKEASSNFMTLNGNWKFYWVKDLDQRPLDFFRADYNDSGWNTLSVPGIWELNGYGDPIYLNVGYAWRSQFKNNPPEVPVRNNHVGSYRKEIDLPADWKGKDIFAHFGSVTSNIYLWVNGKYVGYSEDSKLEAEFNISRYLKPGKNLIAFQVFRWCDGSYLEDQDFFRLSGVGRDCYLYARDARRIEDIRVTPDLDAAYQNGTLTVDLSLSPKALGSKVLLDLSDSRGASVARAELKGEKMTNAVLQVADPKKWTAETPNLYTLKATLEDAKGAVIEVIPLRVGFRKIEMKNGQVLVNGQPVLFKGANRHEMDPDGGYVVSRERMLEDIRIMKQFNINAVRTCHYPDNNLWYDLCDEYGIYMVAEANVESHGMGYGDRTLAKNPAYATAHLERNQRNVQRSFNHPSVIFWSLGNEAGFGPNFEDSYRLVKAEDQSRPVQYEQARGNEFSDVFCPMYYDYASCEKYAQSNPSKPLIQCEYAHAMGNSQGGFKEYWDLVRKYPAFQGGFIWDFVDQSLRWKNKDGVSIYAYGGDFNPYDASDNNFCDNGLISPDRVPNPHVYEVGYYYQSVWTTPADLAKGEVNIYNENFFRDLSDCYAEWTLLADGEEVQFGIVDRLNVAPQQTSRIQLGYDLASVCPDKEILLNIAIKRKSAAQLLPAGFTEARNQLVVRPYRPAALDMAVRISNIDVQAPLVEENDIHYLVVRGEAFEMDFNKQTGYLTKYVVNGLEILKEGSALTPNFWRAPTDNDFGANLQKRYAVWKNPEIKLVSLKQETDGSVVKVLAEYEMKAVSAQLSLTYEINALGAVKVTQKMMATPDAKVSEMFRFGMQLVMPETFEYSRFYGRGPIENYSDRNNSTFLGVYRKTADEQFYSYIRPQENGNKTDIRWWNQTNRGGKGLRVEADAPFSASALHYTIESLDDGIQKDQRHSTEVEEAPLTNFCIDKVQTGLGCINSWGHIPLEKYRLPYGNYEFSFVLSPVQHAF